MLVEEALVEVLDNTWVDEEDIMLAIVGMEEVEGAVLVPPDDDEAMMLLLDVDVPACVDVEPGGVYVAGVTPRTEARTAAFVPLLAESPVYCDLK